MNKEPSGPSAPEPDRWEALGRYFAGESSAEEAADLRTWLEADPRRAELIAELERALARTAATGPGVDVEAALGRVKARMHGSSPIELAGRRRTAPPERSNRRWRTTVMQAAAAIIVVLGVSVLWRSSRTTPEGVSVAAAQTFTTQTGETDTLRLADGTQVILAPASELRVAEGYGGRARTVELDGEAYFVVEHDAARPFSVRAGAATIRDIGTAFVVRKTTADAVRVIVTEGTVVLHSATGQERDGVVLRAGDRGLLDRDGVASTERGAANADDVAFASGRLVFNDAQLTEVSDRLRRWYGVELVAVEPDLAQRRITASFRGEPIEDVLNVIRLALGAGMERKGDTIFVRAAR